MCSYVSADGVLCQVTRAEVIKAVRGYEHVRELLGLDTFKQGSPGHTMFERKFQVIDHRSVQQAAEKIV